MSSPESRAYHQALRHLGSVLRLQGRSTEALTWFDKSIAAATRRDHRGNRAQGLLESAFVQLDLRNTDEAQRLLDATEVILIELQPGQTPLRADLALANGRLELLRNNAGAALVSLQSADAFWRGFDGDCLWAGEAALWLARAYSALGHQNKAEATLLRALRVLRGSPLPLDQKLIQSVNLRAKPKRCFEIATRQTTRVTRVDRAQLLVQVADRTT